MAGFAGAGADDFAGLEETGFAGAGAAAGCAGAGAGIAVCAMRFTGDFAGAGVFALLLPVATGTGDFFAGSGFLAIKSEKVPLPAQAAPAEG